MPEIITKYPEIVLQEFSKSGFICGGKQEKQILKQCPDDHFCRLPTAEICVYNVDEVPKMTQVHPVELFLFPEVVIPFTALLAMIFLLGILLGLKIKKK